MPPRSGNVTRSLVADRVQELIISQGLHPGDPMPTESELGEALGVSRSSVREAIRVLASLDIVEVRHGHGTFVGQMSLAPLISGLMFRARLNLHNDLRTLHEVVQVRIALDLFITDDLIKAHRTVDHAELDEIVQRMQQRADTGESFADEDAAFHSALLAPLGNELIHQLVLAFWEVHTAALPALGIRPAKDILDTVRAHQAMLDALKSADAGAYREAVRAHYRPLQRALAEHDS